MAIREIPLHEIESSGISTIWAVNNSKLSNLGQLGEIFAAIPKLRGHGFDNLRVPQTWLPCELTDQIPRDQLLASTEFRRLVNKRLVILIDARTAEKLNSQAGAERERRTLAAKEDNLRASGVAGTINASIVEIRGVNNEITPPEQVVSFGAKPEAPEVSASAVSTKFKLWAERLEGMDDEDAKSEIRSAQGVKRSEAQYLLNTLTDKPLTMKMLRKALG